MYKKRVTLQNMQHITREEALSYHRDGRPGKLEIRPTKPMRDQHDLSLAYTPGVAEPVKEIADDPAAAYEYTNKGNLVGIITNGTAILGLGNRGALASKPVMEGKSGLFKLFADVDVIDIEIESLDAAEIIRTVELISPTFGAICLEDIRAPECFVIERSLQEKLRIPVFHDDQHGTAIVTVAALLNALEIGKKKFTDVQIVINGAGAAGDAVARLCLAFGASRQQIIMCDSKGVIYRGRKENMQPHKEEWAVATLHRSVADALKGADVFIGVSSGGSITAEMCKSMASHPVIFAMANPDPEIAYEEAKAVRPDAIIATGRSDTPNQVNNVLGFPSIFRGALDVRASAINEPMKIAAARTLAALAREPVPTEVIEAYDGQPLAFGPDYILPKPLDHRVVPTVAPAVARAAMESGLAQKELDLKQYPEALRKRLETVRESLTS